MCLLAALGLGCCTGAALWLPWAGFSWQGLLFSQSAGSRHEAVSGRGAQAPKSRLTCHGSWA